MYTSRELNQAGADYALFNAVQANELEIVKALLKAGASTTYISPTTGNAVLHVAVLKRNPEMIALLLENHADISIKNKNKKTPIYLAADLTYWDCVSTFAENKKVSNNLGMYNMALLLAVHANELGIVESLLKAGASTMCIFEDTGNGVLHEAVLKRNPDMIALLLKNHADISIKNKNNQTPIYLAADLKYWECVNTFVKNRKDNNNSGRYDVALLLAVQANELEVVKALLEAGVSTSCTFANTGNGVLHMSVNNKNLDMLHLLLFWEADITTKNNQNKTALALATDCKDWTAVNAFTTTVPRSIRRVCFLKCIVAYKEETNILSQLPFPIFIEICKFAFPEFTQQHIETVTNKFDITAMRAKNSEIAAMKAKDAEIQRTRSSYIHTIQLFCHKYEEPWFYKSSKESTKLVSDLKQITKSHVSDENKCERAEKVIKNFEEAKGNKESRAKELLLTYRLLNSTEHRSPVSQTPEQTDKSPEPVKEIQTLKN